MSDLILRIEPVQRAEDLRPGLAARLLDPLWLLGRQWMLGEFDGEDAGTPVAVEYALAHYPLQTLYGADGKRPVDGGAPLERHLEAVADPPGGWNPHKRAETAALLARMLHDAGLDAAAGRVVREFALHAGVAAAAGDAVLAHRAGDGQALYEAAVAGDLPDRLGDRDSAPVVDLWRTLIGETLGRQTDQDPVGAWRPQRLEYEAELRCDGLIPPLRIVDHHGGGLGWLSCDLDAAPSGAPPQVQRHRCTPTALRFRGMPQARYWECEDASIDLGAVDAPAAELGRTAMLQLAMVYGNDMFLAPATLPAGGLSGVVSMSVSDTFGDVFGATALDPATRTGPEPGRGWALWAPIAAGVPQPWLFLPPALATPLIGEAVEEAVFARDEMANRVWAIAQTVTGPDGRRQAPTGTPTATGTPTEPDTVADYRYRLATDVPVGWSPLVLESDASGRRLRRAAGDDALARLLPPGDWVHDEEIGREGVRLRIEYVLARGSDGSTASWARVRRSAGHGGAASGLKYDDATPVVRE